MINWAKIKQIKSIYNYLKINNVINLRENRNHFHDRAENHIFFFNKMFLNYLLEYMNSIEIIFVIKKLDDFSQISNLIIDSKIGFDIFHFFLNRISTALRLLNILWKLLIDKKAVETYEYIIEVISNQIFLEYNFCKDNLKILLENYDENKKCDWFIGLLWFYTDFIWKNKKIILLYDNFSWFYKRKYIKIPILLNLDDDLTNFINISLFDNKNEVDIQKRKFVNMEKEELLKESKRVFALLSEGKVIEEDLLHSNMTLLNRLGSDKEIVTNLVVNTGNEVVGSKKPGFFNVEKDVIKNEDRIENDEEK